MVLSEKKMIGEYDAMKKIIESSTNQNIDVASLMSSITSDFSELLAGMVLQTDNLPWSSDDNTEKIAASLVHMSNGASKLLTGMGTNIKEACGIVYGDLYTNLDNDSTDINLFNTKLVDYYRELASEQANETPTENGGDE